MTAYNKVNGDYAGAQRVLLEEVLKGAWGYPGWVMSDWGATPSWEYALKGLDQESGVQIDVDAVGRRVLHRAAARGLRRGQAAQGAPVGHGAPHPALDLRGRHRQVGAAPRRESTWPSTTRSRWRPPARASCCSKNDGVLPLAPTRPRGSR